LKLFVFNTFYIFVFFPDNVRTLRMCETNMFSWWQIKRRVHNIQSLVERICPFHRPRVVVNRGRATAYATTIRRPSSWGTRKVVDGTDLSVKTFTASHTLRVYYTFTDSRDIYVPFICLFIFFDKSNQCCNRTNA